MATTVVIVDDHPGFRASARMLLEAEGYEVVGEAEDGARACVWWPSWIPTWCCWTSSCPTSTASRWPPARRRRHARRDRAGVQPRPRGPEAAGGGQRGPRLHPQVRAVRRRAGGGHRVTGLRRALWALGVAGFIAGAVPLVLALSAPDDIDDSRRSRSRSGRSSAGPSSAPACSRGTGARRTTSARSWPRSGSPGASSGLIVDSHPGVFIVGLRREPAALRPAVPHADGLPRRATETRVARGSAVLGYFVTTVLWWVDPPLLRHHAATTGPATRCRPSTNSPWPTRCSPFSRSWPSPRWWGVVVALRQRWMRSSAHPAPGAGARVRGGGGARGAPVALRSWRT